MVKRTAFSVNALEGSKVQSPVTSHLFIEWDKYMKRTLLILTIIFGVAAAYSQPYKRPVTLNPGSGYVSINEITAGYGLGSREPDFAGYFLGLTTTHGYQLNLYGLRVNSSLSGGVGTGISLYNGGILFPLYGDVRFTSNRKRVSPFIFARSGLLISVDNFHSLTRVFINGGGGVKFRINEYATLSIAPGLYIQMGSGVSRDAFVDLKAGVSFKPN